MICPRPVIPAGEDLRIFGRLVRRMNENGFGRAARRVWRSSGADFVLCLDVISASQCLRLGVPYALRFHVSHSTTPPAVLERLVSGALFATCVDIIEIPGAVVIPHGEDLSRFRYVEHPEALRAVQVATLVDVEMPEIFIRGAAGSRIPGTIVGDGPLQRAVRRLCAETSGRVTWHPPVTRLDLPGLLGGFQIGVATCSRIGRRVFQMKVTEYQASGIYPLVSPWSHLAVDEPGLTRTFTTARELSEVIDETVARWPETLEARRANRDYAIERYDVRRAREIFADILESVFGSRAAGTKGRNGGGCVHQA